MLCEMIEVAQHAFQRLDAGSLTLGQPHRSYSSM